MSAPANHADIRRGGVRSLATSDLQSGAPAVIGIKLVITDQVDLPAPFGPRRPKIRRRSHGMKHPSTRVEVAVLLDDVLDLDRVIASERADTPVALAFQVCHLLLPRCGAALGGPPPPSLLPSVGLFETSTSAVIPVTNGAFSIVQPDFQHDGFDITFLEKNFSSRQKRVSRLQKNPDHQHAAVDAITAPGHSFRAWRGKRDHHPQHRTIKADRQNDWQAERR